MSECVAVLGAGSWGTALALQLTRLHERVILWTRDPDTAAEMQSRRRNLRYLPNNPFPDTLQITHQLDAAVADASMVLLVTPSHVFGDMLDQLRPHIPDGCEVIWACKGLYEGRLLHEVFASRLGDRHAAVLSGPNFAAEVANGLPTATTLAASGMALAQRGAVWFHSEEFRVYTSDDLIGVQLAGALKNVYAIACGISDGLGFGANARAALLTRGLAELQRLANHMGAQPQTLAGLAGVGDLVLTCTDNQSRNRRFGLALGDGSSVAESLASIGQVVEGINTVRHAKALSQTHGIAMPIADKVFDIVHRDKSPHDAVTELLARAPRMEAD